MANGRLVYGAGGAGYPISSSDLLGNALQILAKDLTIDLAGEYSESPTLVAIRKGTSYQDVIRWDVTLGSGDATDAAIETSVLDSGFPGTDGRSYVQDKVVGAELTMGRNKTYNLIKLVNNEVTVARRYGKSAVANLFNSRMKSAIREISKALNTKIFTGSTASNGNIVGIETIYAGTSYANIPFGATDFTGLVAGVDYYPEWKPLSGTFDFSDAAVTLNDGHGVGGSLVAPTVETATVLPPFTSANIVHAFDAFDLCMRMKGRKSNIIITTPRIAESYRQVYKSELTYNINNGEIGRAEMGIVTATYKGRPIIEDAKMPANTVYFLDLGVMELLTLAIDTSIPMDDTDVMANPGQLNLAVGALAKDTTFVNRYEIATLPQLVVYDTRGLNRLKIQA